MRSLQKVLRLEDSRAQRENVNTVLESDLPVLSASLHGIAGFFPIAYKRLEQQPSMLPRFPSSFSGRYSTG
jgi:hypothetical protein